MKKFVNNIKQPLLITVVLMIICGLLFPLLLTGLSQIFFPHNAKGGLVEANGTYVGSKYVGQDFTKPYFMKGRPSAVSYNTYYEDKDGNKFLNNGDEFSGVASGSQNLAPSNPELQKRVEEDIDEFLKSHPHVKKEDIPTDLLTASGSGLDPHISVEGALIQIPEISKASGISEEDLQKIVEDNKEGKVLGIFGEEKINVLGVNIAIAQKMGL